MDCSDACARQHGHGGLDDHRHVYDDSVPLLDAESIREHARQQLNLFQDLRVGDLAVRASSRRLKYRDMPESYLVTSSGFDVPVQCIVAGVESTVRKPSSILSMYTCGIANSAKPEGGGADCVKF